MSVLRYTRGLPASGKTTFARRLVAESLEEDGQFSVRINRDDIRAMLGTTTGQQERFITVMQDRMIEAALDQGYDVIVDDTNFFKGTDKRFRLLAEKFGAEAVCHDFTDVPLEVCIARDAIREASVGEAVIRSMAERYLNGGK